ncbi:methionine gamma-lyase [Bacteroidales bacterium KA00251]|nr:methionine gamma-lyase [Bacteroidales bacterium KA00251]
MRVFINLDYAMMDQEQLKKAGFATKAIHAGAEKNCYGTLATPIYQTSTFVFENAEQGGARFALEEEGYIYSRLGNPTCTNVEKKVAMLEGAEDCVSCASGIGAITSAVWVCLNAGDHIIAGKTLYGCTFAYLEHGLTRYGIDVTFVDMRDPENVRKAMRPNTKVVYVETPANPNMYLTDIQKVAEIAHTQEGVKVIVDNTFATPFITRPLELGADVVVHSATKYLNGHGDVIAGFVCGTKEYIQQARLVGVKDLTGACLSPFDAFLIARGIKTLEIRMQRHCENAQKVAEFLESHPKVKSVAFPGLESFPQRELAKKQMSLPGAMICFEVEGGIEGGRTLMNNLHMLTLAVSLGDAETLIEHPATMTHSPYSPEERAKSDISDGMVRLSVGLENVEDIIADLDQALNLIKK